MLKNPKHEAFAQAVASGASAAMAYSDLVSEGRCSQATAETEGPALARKSQVSLRIQELTDRLKESADKKFDLTREKWLERLLRIAAKAEDAADFSAANGSLREIGKAMPGWYTPEKVEHSGNITLSELLKKVRK